MLLQIIVKTFQKNLSEPVVTICLSVFELLQPPWQFKKVVDEGLDGKPCEPGTLSSITSGGSLLPNS